MKKMLGYILIGLVGLYIVLNFFARWLPDWFRILWDADPHYINHALDEARRSCKYDRRN